MDGERLWQLKKLPSSIVADALDGNGVLPSCIGAVGVSSSMVGPAYTVELPLGDNLGIHIAVARAQSASVIVASVPDDEEYGIWGGILSSAANKRELAGFVTNGFVRDRQELTQLQLPVFARGTSLRHTRKKDPGRHGVSLSIGGILISPGDFVVGDSDGIVVAPHQDIDTVIRRANDLFRKEADLLRGVHEGKSTLDLLGLRDLMG